MAEDLPEARDHVCPLCNGIGAVPARVVVDWGSAQAALRDFTVTRAVVERGILNLSRRRPDKMREAVQSFYHEIIQLWISMGVPDV